MRSVPTLLALGFVVTSLAFACSSKERTSFDGSGGSGDAGPPSLGLGGDGGASATLAVTLKGKVYAPNGTLPMGKALVYVSLEKPAAIPEGAYCDECVTLPDHTFGYSEADGSFELPLQLPKGKSWLVVQKGQFRRVRELDVAEEGEIKVAKSDSTLPGNADPDNGDDVPKMLVVSEGTAYDEIESSLSKLGIDDVTMSTTHDTLRDLTELMKYHVVFIPCDVQNDARVEEPEVQQVLQDYVKAGGRLYVTDWSYEWVNRPFAGWVSWVDDTGTLGSAAKGVWSAPATADDQDLGDWLAASGDASFDVEGNWTTIASVNTQPGLNAKGETVDITPKVWMSADKNGSQVPTTVSFEQQCGRVMFSTYHTEPEFGGSPELHAQEKALLYVLLEVGVCIGQSNTPQ